MSSLKYRPLKAVPGGSPVPLIELQWRSDTISVEQDIPIEKPCVGSEVRRIHDISVKISTESPPCDFHVDLDPMELKPVVGILDSVRGFAKRVVVSLTRGGGDVCFVAQAGMSMIGVRFPMLNEYNRDGTRMAGVAGLGQSAEVDVPQLIQELKSIQVTSPTIILCGILEAGDFFQVIPWHKKDALGCTEGVAPFAFDFRLPICRED